MSFICTDLIEEVMRLQGPQCGSQIEELSGELQWAVQLTLILEKY